MNMVTSSRYGLGIDAGGTQTRWCLVNQRGDVVADDAVIGLSALMLNSADGVIVLRDALTRIAEALRPHVHGDSARRVAVCAGFTGVDGDSRPLQTLIAEVFAINLNCVTVRSDIEIAFRAAFEPGAGYLVYAGTGSIAAYIDEHNHFHRAGGRGALLDDGGGGYWIAREALRRVWRAEDEHPGAWQQSPLARALFDRIGDHEWPLSRQFFYTRQRGDIGLLSLAVAESANADPAAASILQAAGEELARLAQAMLLRFGTRPVAIAGRAFDLHPCIQRSMIDALPRDVVVTRSAGVAYRTAALIALHSVSDFP
jgi:glucosamine kinase